MKFKEVTWYSKLAAAILFVLLPFLGFYAGMRYQEALFQGVNNDGAIVSIPANKDATSSAKNKDNDDLDQRTLVKKINNEKLSISVVLDDGSLRYSGAVVVPTPCHEVKADAIVAESHPEQVRIDLTVVIKAGPTQFCAQVVTNKEFSGEAKVSSEAQVSVYLDGEKID